VGGSEAISTQRSVQWATLGNSLPRGFGEDYVVEETQAHCGGGRAESRCGFDVLLAGDESTAWVIVGYGKGRATDRQDGSEHVAYWDQAVVGAAFGQRSDTEQAAGRVARDHYDAFMPQTLEVRGRD